MDDLDFEVKDTTNGKPGDVAFGRWIMRKFVLVYIYQRKNLKLKKGDRFRAKADDKNRLLIYTKS